MHYIHDPDLLPKLRRYIGWHYFAPNVKPNMYIIAESKLIIPIVSSSPSSYTFLQSQLDKFKLAPCDICMEDREYYVQCANSRCKTLLCAKCSLHSSILSRKCPFCREDFVPKDVLEIPPVPQDIQVSENENVHVMFLDNGQTAIYNESLHDRIRTTHCILGFYDPTENRYTKFVDSIDNKVIIHNMELEMIFNEIFI